MGLISAAVETDWALGFLIHPKQDGERSKHLYCYAELFIDAPVQT
jgi:hypothetical protein